MNNRERLIIESDKFGKIAKQKLGYTAGKWLNIAFKLDYISLDFKEKIDSLLRKKDEMQRFGVDYRITRRDVEDMIRITEIASNTVFHEFQLESV